MAQPLEGYGAPVWVSLEEIDPRPASEVRASADDEAIADYAERSTDAPPIFVIADSAGRHWTTDGRHRHKAARRKGARQIRCRIKSGTYLDAFRDAAHANADHGVRVTKADKRARVLATLAHPEMGANPDRPWSQGRIAEWCGVAQSMVSRLDSRPGHLKDDLKAVGKDGKTYPVRKKSPKKPKPAPSPASNLPATSERSSAPGIPDIEDAPALGPDPAPEPWSEPVALKRDEEAEAVEDAVSEPDASDELEGSDDEPALPEPERWERLWAETRALIERNYEACPEDERGSFVFKLSILTDRYLSEHSEIENQNISYAL